MSDCFGSFTTPALESVIIYGSSHLETGKWHWSLVGLRSLYSFPRIWPIEEFFFKIPTLQTHPCNENRVFPVQYFQQGSQLMKTVFSLSGNTTQGKPCSGPVRIYKGLQCIILIMAIPKSDQKMLPFRHFRRDSLT